MLFKQSMAHNELHCKLEKVPASTINLCQTLQVQAFMDAQWQRALNFIQEHRGKIEALAEELRTKQVGLCLLFEKGYYAFSCPPWLIPLAHDEALAAGSPDLSCCHARLQPEPDVLGHVIFASPTSCFAGIGFKRAGAGPRRMPSCTPAHTS
jgi:hypothetical protein